MILYLRQNQPFQLNVHRRIFREGGVSVVMQMLKTSYHIKTKQ